MLARRRTGPGGIMPSFWGAGRLAGFSATRWRWIAFAAAGLAYVALYLHLPVGVLADAQFDDAWFFGRAHDLAAGRWLGPFSQMTLMKGPGYPLFLALCYALGVSAILAQALLHLAACALFARAVWSIGGCWPLAAAVFAGCLWHPYLFPTRLIRDDIYAAQTLIYLACLIQYPDRSADGARGSGWVDPAPGLSLAWLWITREEGVWIVPGSLVLCAAILWRDRWRVADVARAAVAAAIALVLVMAVNFAAYRTLSIVDFKGRPTPAPSTPCRACAWATRSPMFRSRARCASGSTPSAPPSRPCDRILDHDGRVWMTFGCQVYPSTCGDYAGGWFIWALRDAVAARGLYDTPAHADAFYRTLAAEIRAACRDGRLTCRAGW